MPDDFSSLVNASAPKSNPIGSFVEGINNGAQWAHSLAALDLQKQTVQNQVENHKLMRDEFQTKVGTQMYNEYKEILPMDPGNLKNTLLQGFQDKWVGAGFPVSESWLAGAKDTGYSAKLADVMSQIDKQMGLQTDPEIYKKVMGQIPGGMAQELVMKKIEQAPKIMEDMRMRSMMMAAMTKRQDIRISASEMNKAISDAEKGTKNDVQVMGTMQRLDDMIAGAVKGKYLNTPQFWAKVQAEEQKIIRGNNSMAEGSAERSRADGVGTYVTNLVQKLKTGPQGMDLKAWEDQVVAETHEMKKSYMDNVDTQHAQLSEAYRDYPQATKALDRMFGSLRNTMGKRLGGWQGFKGEKTSASTTSEGAANASAPQVRPSGPSDDDKARARQVQGVLTNALKQATTDAQREAAKAQARKLVHPDLADKVTGGGSF